MKTHAFAVKRMITALLLAGIKLDFIRDGFWSDIELSAVHESMRGAK